MAVDQKSEMCLACCLAEWEGLGGRADRNGQRDGAGSLSGRAGNEDQHGTAGDRNYMSYSGIGDENSEHCNWREIFSVESGAKFVCIDATLLCTVDEVYWEIHRLCTETRDNRDII